MLQIHTSVLKINIKIPSKEKMTKLACSLVTKAFQLTQGDKRLILGFNRTITEKQTTQIKKVLATQGSVKRTGQTLGAKVQMSSTAGKGSSIIYR